MRRDGQPSRLKGVSVIRLGVILVCTVALGTPATGAHAGTHANFRNAHQRSSSARPRVTTPDEVLSGFVDAFNARDAAHAAATFSADGELMLPDAPPAAGRAAIESAFETLFRTERIVDLLSTTVTRTGSLAVVSGRLTMSTRTPIHGADLRAGSYLAVMRQVNRTWEITHLMFTLPLRPDFVG